MRLLLCLAAAGCVSLLSAPSFALSNWPEEDWDDYGDIKNPDGCLDVAIGGDAHLTGVASDGYYGVIIAWQNDVTRRAYAKRLDPLGVAYWGPYYASVFDVGAALNTQTDAAVTDDSLRGGYVAWVDDRDGRNVIYLQHIDKDGGRVGVFQDLDVVASEDVRKLRGTLTFDGTVNVVGTGTLFMTEVDGDDWIRLESDGTWYQVVSGGPTDDQNLILTANGPVGTGVASVVKYDPTTFSDCHTPKLLANNEGCFVAYLNDTLALPTSDPATPLVPGDGTPVPLLQMTYISSEGERLWTTDIDFPHPDTGYEIHDDGEEGVLVVWHVPPYADRWKPLKEASTSYAVRIAPDGEGVWGGDPVLLFSRRKTTAEVSYDKNRRELWVSGPWDFEDEAKPTVADGGNYAVVNKLLSTGSWAWGTWSRPFQWDSWEKRIDNKCPPPDNRPLTVPFYDNFETQQYPVGLAGDGIGGVYMLVKDSRRSFYSSTNIATLTGTLSFSEGSNVVTGDAIIQFVTEIDREQFVRVGANMEWYKVTKVNDEGAVGDSPEDELELESPYIGPDVSGPSYVADTFGLYHDPYQNIYAHHVSPSGAISWQDSGYTIRWNDDLAFKYATIGSDLELSWSDYPWIEGLTAVRNPVGSVKDYVHSICEPWTTYNPVPGDRRVPEVSIVWVEDYESEYDPDNEVKEYDAIRCTQMDLTGQVLDWTPDDPWRLNVLDVYNGLGDVLPGDFRMEVVSDERYGMTVVWEQNANIYAKHVNYYRMYMDDRAYPMGQGPDIFPPAPVTGLTAAAGIGYVKLTWTNPAGGDKPLEDFAGVMIRRSTAGYPGTDEQGDWVYEGPGTIDPDDPLRMMYIDTKVEIGLTYYYSAFAFDTELSLRNFSGPDKAEVTVDFGDVWNFQAYGSVVGAPRVDLSWETPGGTQYAGVRILRSEVDFPPAYNSHVTDPANNALVGDFPDPQASEIDSPLGLGVPYYYTAFAYNSMSDYTDGVTASAVPLQGVTIDDTNTQSGTVVLDMTAPTDPPATTFIEVTIRRSDTDFPATETDGVLAGTVSSQTTSSYTFTDPGPAPDGLVNDKTYYYSVFAHYFYLGEDVYTLPDQVEAIPGDRDPPAEVANFSVTSGQDKVVPISWDTPTDDWAKVDIRRSSDAATVSNGAVVFTEPDDGTSPFTDSGVINGQTYWYAAISIDAAGNESPFTALSATPIDITPPSPPGLTIRPWVYKDAGNTVSVVEITLTDPTDIDWVETVLLRGPSASPSSTQEPGVVEVNLIDATAPAAPNVYYDKAVGVGQTYYYAAWARDDDNNISTIVEAGPVTVVDNFPPVFTSVTATPSGPPHQAVLDWTIRELDPTDYLIAYGPTTGCHLGSFGDNTKILNMTRTDTITDLWGGTTFYFRITMTDDKNASATFPSDPPLPTEVYWFDTTLTTGVGGEDEDGDGMADAWEIEHFGDITTRDGSDDVDDLAAYAADMPSYVAFTDLDEYRYGTNPALFDTDSDGTDDRQEIVNGSNPLKAPTPPISFKEGCGAVPGPVPQAGGPLAVMLLALAAALRGLRRRRPEGSRE